MGITGNLSYINVYRLGNKLALGSLSNLIKVIVIKLPFFVLWFSNSGRLGTFPDISIQ